MEIKNETDNKKIISDTLKPVKQLSNYEISQLMWDFSSAIAVLKNPDEIQSFLTDLLTKREVIFLAKRIKIAKLLIKGYNYQDISNILKVSHSTISKINQWLMESGEGFRIVSERVKEKPVETSSVIDKSNEFYRFKRSHPAMFWPQFLIEDIVKNMSKRQKSKFEKTIQKLDHKSKLYKNLSEL